MSGRGGGSGGDRRGPRFFMLLLRVYPSSFQRRFAAAMAETFAEELSAARRRGPGAVAALWVRTVFRVPFLAFEEHARIAGGPLQRLTVTRAHGTSLQDGAHSVIQDTRFAWRSLARTPGFTMAAVLSVGLGVGATTSLYSLANALLFRPLPVPAPEQLVSIQEQRTGVVSTGLMGMRVPYERYRAYEEATAGAFSGLAAENLRYLSLRSEGPAFSVAAVLVSGNYFDVVGIRPAVGRFFRSDDEPAVVLSHRLWQSRFGGRSDVAGRTVHLNGRVMTVAGVAARDFGGLVGFISADLWVPHGAHGGAGWPGAWVTPIGRLRAGVDPAVAASMVNPVALRLPPDEGAEVHGARVEPVESMPAMMLPVVGGFLGMLVATALLVLLIASANIAGMLLARAVARRREVGVRLALGASRGRLVRQLLTESVVLFLMGGAAGVLVAIWATRLLSRVRLPITEPVLIDASPDVRVLLLGLGIALVTGLVFGLVPALQASRLELVATLKDGDRAGSARDGRGRGVFVGAQLAMSVLLLVTAGLFVRTLQRAIDTDPGFTAEGVVIATTNLDPHGYDEERGRAFYARLIERVQALPGVETAALAQLALLTGDSEGRTGWRPDPDTQPLRASVNAVDGSYFETLRVPLIAGRGIADRDIAGARPVLVVNQTFAERLWPGQNPIGREVLYQDTRYEVVGVSRDGKYALFGEEPTSFVFLSLGQRYASRQVLHIRTREGIEPTDVIQALRQEVAALDRDVAVERAIPLTAAVGSSLFPQRFAATLIGTFGVLGLVLAGLGVYGVLAHSVAQRTRELGIRVALGARSRDVLRLVLGRGALLAAAGTTAGLAVAAVVTRFLQGLLYGVSPLDPATFVGAAVVLGTVALLASYLPARRALCLDPTETLRQE